jgi:4-hydroxy-tetrahydrodipicolinate reductase
MTTHIAINGATGRMGRALIHACTEYQESSLQAALVRESSNFIGQDAGTVAGIVEQGVDITADRIDALGKSDVWIDFTLPEGVMDAVEFCLDHNMPMVIGTTGLSEAQTTRIREAAEKIPLVFAPNMSVGVNLCLSLLKTAARTLGDDYDIEIVEAHHKNKVDAPSGTAIRMGEVIAEAAGVDLKQKAEYTRHGNIGVREKGSIGFQTVRAGDIVGEHTVLFAGIGERIEISHKASSRLTFARGAIRAAIWLKGKPAGLYDMQDVLELS